MKAKNSPYLSVCIPTYEMHGLGGQYLKQSLDMLQNQTFKDFEVVISDNSCTGMIKNVCRRYKGKLEINYYKNTDVLHGMSTNVNNSIKRAKGLLVKILFQDDYLYDGKSLEQIVASFDLKKDKWLLNGYEHTTNRRDHLNPKYPYYNDKIYLGENTIGSPSILTIKNDNPLFFDVNLKWFMDCDYYKRCHEKFGKPKIINKILTVIRTGAHQITNTEVTKIIEKGEQEYMLRKHNPQSSNLNLKNVTLVAVTGIDPQSSAKALELSMFGVDYYDIVLISHNKPKNLNKRITFRQCQPNELVSKDPKNKNDYSRFMAYSLCNYIDSEFALVVHNDAFVLRPHKWSKDFLNYDYIGAPWPKGIHFTDDGTNIRVGNGGFSLRSRKLLNVFNDLKLPFTDNGTGFFNEDGLICVYYRKQLEKSGIRFATVEVASSFSHEKDCSESKTNPFGFHNNKKVIPKFFFARYYLRKLFKKI